MPNFTHLLFYLWLKQQGARKIKKTSPVFLSTLIKRKMSDVSFVDKLFEFLLSVITAQHIFHWCEGN